NIYKKMNVKSRAQLIVWCLPHIGFVEKEERQAEQEARNNVVPGLQPGIATTTTIPAGNATVASTVGAIPTINRAPGMDNNGNGGTNAGSFGI
ncbi:MAG: hypothetical protein KDD61_17805, partial [Bdellovibrionales bacterium]|nr:hypothetical protein [Bdellovibrionales bacterium]